jgi:hypothetical protein
VKAQVLDGDPLRHSVAQPDGDRFLAGGPELEGDRRNRKLVLLEPLDDGYTVDRNRHLLRRLGAGHTSPPVTDGIKLTYRLLDFELMCVTRG